jgi:hypothetical protein
MSRFLGCTGPRERKHRPVLEGHVTGMFLQTAFGEVERCQQLAPKVKVNPPR